MREEDFEPVRFAGCDRVREGEEIVEIARYSAMRERFVLSESFA